MERQGGCQLLTYLHIVFHPRDGGRWPTDFLADVGLYPPRRSGQSVESSSEARWNPLNLVEQIQPVGVQSRERRTLDAKLALAERRNLQEVGPHATVSW